MWNKGNTVAVEIWNIAHVSPHCCCMSFLIKTGTVMLSMAGRAQSRTLRLVWVIKAGQNIEDKKKKCMWMQCNLTHWENTWSWEGLRVKTGALLWVKSLRRTSCTSSTIYLLCSIKFFFVFFLRMFEKLLFSQLSINVLPLRLSSCLLHACLPVSDEPHGAQIGLFWSNTN